MIFIDMNGKKVEYELAQDAEFIVAMENAGIEWADCEGVPGAFADPEEVAAVLDVTDICHVGGGCYGRV